MRLGARYGSRPEGGDVRDLIADAVGDPSLEVVYWNSEDSGRVDRRGGRAREPPVARPRSRGHRGPGQPGAGGDPRARSGADRRAGDHRRGRRVRPHGPREPAPRDAASLLAAGAARVARADHVGRGPRTPAHRTRPARRRAAEARVAPDPAGARRRPRRGASRASRQAPARAGPRRRRRGRRGAVPRAWPGAADTGGTRSRGGPARRGAWRPPEGQPCMRTRARPVRAGDRERRLLRVPRGAPERGQARRGRPVGVGEPVGGRGASLRGQGRWGGASGGARPRAEPGSRTCATGWARWAAAWRSGRCQDRAPASRGSVPVGPAELPPQVETLLQRATEALEAELRHLPGRSGRSRRRWSTS